MTTPPPEPFDGAGPTEDDEEDVLDLLYGYPDEDGVYRGESADGIS